MDKYSNKIKTFLDPIHGPVQLYLNDQTDNLLLSLIDSHEFQRLRRIKQMGFASFTFHGAEHTRLGHSIGTMFIAKKMINHFSNKYPEINRFKTEILVSALIHDIGHGPLSHTSEKLTRFTHEDWTKRIISGNSEINLLLKTYNKNLPERILQIFEYNIEPLFLSQIISGYIDCDRLDYLHRDSYYVGVPYGLTGSDRIIASLEIDNDTQRLVVNESIGIDAIIHYLHARYSMYQQVYQHKKNLACDFLLKKIIERVRQINPKNTSISLIEWVSSRSKKIEDINIDSYLEIDDHLLASNIQNWAIDPTGDKILKDLSYSFISRKLFKSVEFRQGTADEKINEFLDFIKNLAEKKGLDPDYYLGIEQSALKPYEPYQVTKHKTGKAIFVKQKNGQLKELSEISRLVKALTQENIIKTCLVFKPDLEDEIKSRKGYQEFFK